MRPVFLLFVLAISTTLAACSSTPEYNDSVFAFEIDNDKLAADKIRTVIIPHVNLGQPSRNYLEKEAPRIDAKIAAYLKENGYKVLPQRDFTREWNTAVRAFGDPVDPTTGKANMATFSRIMQSVRDQLRETTELDAFVFTDLVELEVMFGQGIKRVARWDGVTRQPPLQGPGQGVSTDFNWAQPVAAASIMVSIYDMELQRVFISRGGLDATDAIDTRSSGGRFVRRRAMLENESFLIEGIKLSLHPFITMEKYPGKAP